MILETMIIVRENIENGSACKANCTMASLNRGHCRLSYVL